MKSRIIFYVSVIIIGILMMSCSNNGMFLGMNQTNVELSRAGYVFGFSLSLGSSTQTFAIGRVEGTGMLYKEALEDLWKNFEAKHGKIDGRKLALANVRYDSEALNLFVYTGVKVFVRADVVEFTK